MENTVHLSDLLGALEELTSLYSEILSAVLLEREALLAYDEHALLDSGHVLEDLLARASQCEQRRASAALGICANDEDGLLAVLQDSKIVDEDMRRALLRAACVLKQTMLSVKHANHINSAMIERRLAYSRFVSNLVSAANGYTPDGTVKTRKLSRVSLKV